MEKDNSTEAKMKIIFASHPKAKSFHFTSDGQAFRLASDAKLHAKDLEDKAVTEITREMAESGEILKQVQDDATGTLTLNSFQGQGDNGAKNEFQEKGTAEELPYGHDDRGRNVAEIATDAAEKVRENVEILKQAQGDAPAKEILKQAQGDAPAKEILKQVQDDEAQVQGDKAKKASSTKKSGK